MEWTLPTSYEEVIGRTGVWDNKNGDGLSLFGQLVLPTLMHVTIVNFFTTRRKRRRCRDFLQGAHMQGS
jgi:hypothetical protein